MDFYLLFPSFCLSSPSCALRSVGCGMGAANQGERSRVREGRRHWRGRREVWPFFVVRSNPSVHQGFEPLPFPTPISPAMEVEGRGGGGSGCCNSNIKSETSIVHSSSCSPSPLHHFRSSTKWRSCWQQRLSHTRGFCNWLWPYSRAPAQQQIPHGAFTHAGTGSKALHCLTTTAETHTNTTPLLQASGK